MAVVVALVALAPAHKAFAATQNPNGAFMVVVSPPSIGAEVLPGHSTAIDLKVQNQGIATEHVKVTLMKFSAQGQNGTPKLEDFEPSDDFDSWVSFSKTKFDAEPSVWNTITMTIKPPVGAAFGYYYAVIFSRDGAAPTKGQSNLLGAVASLVLLDVKAPGAKRQAVISEFSTPNKVQEFLPVDFTVRMHNTGNTHVAPRGNIFITRNGKNVATLEVNLKKGYILPDSYRKFTATWSDGTPVYRVKTADGKTVLDKNNKPVSELNWDKFGLSKLRAGKYNAKLVMVYNDGQGDVAQTSYLSFWIMPWRVLAVVAALSLVVVAGLWTLFVRPLRRFIKQKRSHGRRFK